MGLRRLTTLWRRASFTLKFAVVLATAGAMIAVVPLLLANAEGRSEALDRAADKAGIAQNLVQGQRNALSSFVSSVAAQVSGSVLFDDKVLSQTLAADVGVNPNGDVLGIVVSSGDVVVLRGRTPLPVRSELVRVLLRAVSSRQLTAAGPDGTPWLISSASVPDSAAVAFVGRPVTDSLVTAIDHNLATNADPSELAVIRGSSTAVAGSVGGHDASHGAALDPKLRSTLGTESSEPFVLSNDGRNVAVATTNLGAGYRMVVSTPVGAVVIAWPSLLLLIGLILLAMIVIVLVVETDLQRPLRRLDRAVAALGRGEFNAPVPLGSEDELGRLGATFEDMRSQLHASMRETHARAAVASELNSHQQPLLTALSKVCGELRRTTEVDAVLLLATSSEMADSFAVADGIPVDLKVDLFIGSDGPLGAGFRSTGASALLVSAAPASLEAQLAMREFCVAPLRGPSTVLGVLAFANMTRGFGATDPNIVFSAAEQMALALERYRMIAAVQRQASIDDLTGLHNHRFFVDYLGQQVAIAERLGTPLAVLMLDIDHFKTLNDTHGHQAGDTALAAFADTLRRNVRRSDLAARYGGEEFAVIMTNTSVKQARVVADKIRRAVAAMEVFVDVKRPELAMTVSVGGASFPEDTGDAGDLLRLADEALYHSKRAGRDRVTMSVDHRKPQHVEKLRVLVNKSPREAAGVAGGSDRPQK